MHQILGAGQTSPPVPGFQIPQVPAVCNPMHTRAMRFPMNNAQHVVTIFKKMVIAQIPVQMMVLNQSLEKLKTLLKLTCSMPLLARSGVESQISIPEGTERVSKVDSKVERVSSPILIQHFCLPILLPVERVVRVSLVDLSSRNGIQKIRMG